MQQPSLDLIVCTIKKTYLRTFTVKTTGGDDQSEDGSKDFILLATRNS
jgi:hypothetical protein